MTDLTDKEKSDAVLKTMQYIIPIVTKYQITDVETCTAISEAFHAGIKFALEEIREG